MLYFFLSVKNVDSAGHVFRVFFCFVLFFVGKWPKCCSVLFFLERVGMTASSALCKKKKKKKSHVPERQFFIFHLENILKTGLYIKM